MSCNRSSIIVRHSNITNPKYRRRNSFTIIEYYTKTVYFISLITSKQ
nr:MAG TPA: hypothetical protein [Crassvirales sp.]